jgi:hypothetical protein
VISDPIETLLSRLDGVRKSGKGWTAKCPAHADRTASLSIASGDDGRVLLHCFSGCSAGEVVAATGLQLGDLFVRCPTEEMTFVDRAVLKERLLRAQWRAALNALTLEARIVHLAAREIAARKELSPEDMRRLEKAVALIDSAQEVLSGKQS